LTVSEYRQVNSTFGKVVDLAGKTLVIVLIAEEPVAFHLSVKFNDLVDVELPLFQINFFPDLIHVKVFEPTTDSMPTFEHLAPGLAAAVAGVGMVRVIISASSARQITRPFMPFTLKKTF
jgi:hypothetical protein